MNEVDALSNTWRGATFRLVEVQQRSLSTDEVLSLWRPNHRSDPAQWFEYKSGPTRNMPAISVTNATSINHEDLLTLIRNARSEFRLELSVNAINYNVYLRCKDVDSDWTGWQALYNDRPLTIPNERLPQLLGLYAYNYPADKTDEDAGNYVEPDNNNLPIAAILGHRRCAHGGWEYDIRWEDYHLEVERTWEPEIQLMSLGNTLLQYKRMHLL